MVEWQITHRIKQKLACQNVKHAFRTPRQQRKAPALELNDVKFIEGTITYPTAGEYNDLIDGKYEKIIFVKTWEGRTITAEISPEHTKKMLKKENRSQGGNPDA